jgi:hypothetical protein
MYKYVQILTIIFIGFFIIPIASYADGRVRFNYRVAGSTSDPGLGTKTVSSYKQVDGSLATGKDVLDSSSYNSFSLHYVSDYGLGFLAGGEILLGLFQYNTSYKTNITCTSVWLLGATPLCSDGLALATRKASGYSRSLDIGYVYPIGEMSVGGGMALPVLGSGGDLSVEWTPLGGLVSGMQTAAQYAAGGAPVEKLEPEGKKFQSFFLNFGYSFEDYEALLNYRTVSTTVDAPLDSSKGVGAMLSKSVLSSDSTVSSISLGFGYRF